MAGKSAFSILPETVSNWSSDKAPKMAAALSFYAAFALAPLLIIAIGVAGYFFGPEAAQGQVVGQIQGLVGEKSARDIEEILRNVNQPKTGLIATLIGMVALFLGASGVFGELQDSFDVIWKVKKRPGRGVLGTIRDRFLSFTMVLGIGFLLMVSLIVSAALEALGIWIAGPDGGTTLLMKALNFIISFGVISALFALMFKILPDARTPWKYVWLGGAATAFLFTLGKFAIGLYLGKSTVSSTYGAAGAFLIVLLWVYYSSQILFLGAEFTRTVSQRFGPSPQPDADAVALRENALRPRRAPREREIVIHLGRKSRGRNR